MSQQTQFDQMEIYSESTGHEAPCWMRGHRHKAPPGQGQWDRCTEMAPGHVTQWREGSPGETGSVRLTAEGVVHGCVEVRSSRCARKSMNSQSCQTQKEEEGVAGEGAEETRRSRYCQSTSYLGESDHLQVGEKSRVPG